MDSYQFSFEKLEVWQLARKLTTKIYKHSANFPAEEKYLLTSQIRRASVSIAANLAEGSTRIAVKDKAHFTTIAFSSLMEVYSHLIIAVDLGYLKNSDLVDYKAEIQNLSVKLSNLKMSQLKRLGKFGVFFWSLFLPTISQQLIPLC